MDTFPLDHNHPTRESLLKMEVSRTPPQRQTGRNRTCASAIDRWYLNGPSLPSSLSFGIGVARVVFGLPVQARVCRFPNVSPGVRFQVSLTVLFWPLDFGFRLSLAFIQIEGCTITPPKSKNLVRVDDPANRLTCRRL